MELVIKLNEGKTLKDAAIKLQQFNTVAEAMLVNGPIQCNPDSIAEVPVFEDIPNPDYIPAVTEQVEFDGPFGKGYTTAIVTPAIGDEFIQVPKLDAEGVQLTQIIDAELGFLGDLNTPVNEFGYVRVMVNNYRKLIIEPEMAMFLGDTFKIVTGEPTEDSVDADGNPIVVMGGSFT